MRKPPRKRLLQLLIALAVLCALAGGLWLWQAVKVAQTEARLWEVAIPVPEDASNVTQTVRRGVRDLRFQVSDGGSSQPELEFYRNELGGTGWQPYAAEWVKSPGEWLQGPVVTADAGPKAHGALTPTGDVRRSYQYLWWNQRDDLLALLVVDDTSGWRGGLSGQATSAGRLVTLQLFDRARMEQLMDQGGVGSMPREHTTGLRTGSDTHAAKMAEPVGEP